MTKKIIITGTHLTPAQELIKQLLEDKTHHWEIVYIGRIRNSISKNPSIESIVIPKENIKFYGINCGNLDRKFLSNSIKGIPSTILGINQAQRILSIEKPDIIVSFGGYVSVPVILAGFLKKIPSITHEQTFSLGLATKINSLFTNKVALSFPILNTKKTIVTGNLLRRELFISSDLKISKPIIFVTAGNQGSIVINSHIKKILPSLKKYYIIHQTGNIDFNKYKKLEKQYSNYKVYDYIPKHEIGSVFNNASIIISRSGANTAQEIVALNKNSILIPLPFASKNEQLVNALFVKKQLPKNTIIIPQIDLSSELLIKAIYHLSKTHSSKPKTVKANYNLLKLINEMV